MYSFCPAMFNVKMGNGLSRLESRVSTCSSAIKGSSPELHEIFKLAPHEPQNMPDIGNVCRNDGRLLWSGHAGLIAHGDQVGGVKKP